jgi:mRNA-degrading endonuclease RelE of RelBE toxin-antitoxin system
MKKKILNVELKIVGNPDKTTELHGALKGKCKGLLHARVDRNMRILYEPDHEHKIIFLTDFLPHREMDKKCS